jgi:hypothetical protein
MNHLQPEKTGRNGAGPQEEKQAHKPKARQLHGHGARGGIAVPVGSKSCLHGESLGN